MRNEFSFVSSDGMTIQCYSWLPSPGPAKAVIQLAHGSLEHALRYDAFAMHLANSGFAVYSSDIRGHGATARTEAALSYFADDPDGWQIALNDVRVLMDRARSEHPGVPAFMYGHSMGAFLVGQYICSDGADLAGAIMSGTGGGRPLLILIGFLFARLLMLVRGRRHKSAMLHSLLYGALNKSVKDPKTDYDFLSRDPAVVQAYIDDPRCGTTITTEYGYEMVKGVQFIVSDAAFRLPRKQLPILLVSGEKCPVAGPDGDAAEIRNVKDRYVRGGMEDVTLRVYPGARHETLNEINKEEVYSDITAWLDSKL